MCGGLADAPTARPLRRAVQFGSAAAVFAPNAAPAPQSPPPLISLPTSPPCATESHFAAPVHSHRYPPARIWRRTTCPPACIAARGCLHGSSHHQSASLHRRMFELACVAPPTRLLACCVAPPARTPASHHLPATASPHAPARVLRRTTCLHACIAPSACHCITARACSRFASHHLPACSRVASHHLPARLHRTICLPLHRRTRLLAFCIAPPTRLLAC
jgi:hypothetical protein